MNSAFALLVMLAGALGLHGKSMVAGDLQVWPL